MGDFPDDNAFFIQAASNASIAIAGETVRGIYDAPDRQAGAFGEALTSFDPQVSLLQEDCDRLGVKNGTPLTVTLDARPAAPMNYQAKHASSDGAGLAQVTLKKGN